MNTPEKTPPIKFSSRDRTEFVKFHLLASAFVPTVLMFILLASTREPVALVFAGVFLAVSLGGFFLVISLVRTIKLVALEGDHFLISDSRTTIRVPTSHLCRVERDQDILLHFTPATAFGSQVRMIPAKKLFNTHDYERTVAFLFDLVVANGYHPTAWPVQRLKRTPE